MCCDGKLSIRLLDLKLCRSWWNAQGIIIRGIDHHDVLYYLSVGDFGQRLEGFVAHGAHTAEVGQTVTILVPEHGGRRKKIAYARRNSAGSLTV